MTILKDVQSLIDTRGISIQNVGVSDVCLPFLIRTKAGSYQSVLATIKLSVELPMENKGTHMSRFIGILSEWSQKPISVREMEAILTETLLKLEADYAELDIYFKFFVEKVAPVSGLKSLLDVDCYFGGKLAKGKVLDFILGVKVPFTSLCPCSKEISKYGAHNQRGLMKVRVKYLPKHFIWIEDLITLMESQGSSQIYPLLKREDEKYVTEIAYENPKFVEDILRDLVLSLRSQEGLEWFEVECENYESIHNHNAYAKHAERLK